MTTILVADDHDLVRTGIVRLLEDIVNFKVVGEAKTGEESVKLARELKPDIVLMDVKMPGFGGIEATKKILASCEATRVIAVSGVTDNLFTEKLMKAGASGYVTKDAEFDEIVKAIYSVQKGKPYMSSEMAQELAFRKFSGAGHDQSPFEILSERELQVSLMIANGEKPPKIAAALCVSPKTVNSYRYRIFEKLHIKSDVELVRLAIKYKLLDP
ncbi:MAG: response regulator [Cellvibrionaceae bacterium]|nr:response regulator [Cellvibrionaceae bacterium]